MKLSDLRPCDCCRAPLVMPPHTFFHVVRLSASVATVTIAGMAILAEASRRRAYGLAGLPLHAFEGPEADRAVEVLADLVPLPPELLLCVECYCSRPLGELARLVRDLQDATPPRGLAS